MNRPTRVVLGLLVAAVTLFVLFTIVFPWVNEQLNSPTLG